MLRKIFAKLRESIAPSKTPKKSKPGPVPAPATQARDKGAKRPSQGKEQPARDSRRKNEGAPRHSQRDPQQRDSQQRGTQHRDQQHRESPLRGRERFAQSATKAQPAAPAPVVAKQDTSFSKLGLTDALALAIVEKGYTEPTPIQAQAIPVVLQGGDVMGSAQTGTGKTAAFALPILQRLGEHGPLRCLILEPTRELALQVEQSFLEYQKYTNLRTTVVYGGVGYGKQVEALQRGSDILVATPGRLLDLLEQRVMSMRDIKILVLDEVDRMLDMGFLPDVKRIVEKCPVDRQTLFFSATLPPEIAKLASWAVRDPVRIEIGHLHSPADTVSHAFYPVVEAQKFDLLVAMLARTNFDSVLVFSRTKVGADRVAAWLKGHSHTVGVMHSDRNMNERAEALEGFKSGKYEVLVATDIAARGLDIAGISHVINYDVPENPEDYVHRIGRTGRAAKTGEAFTIVGEDDVRHARSIERYVGTPIERKRLEGFDYTYSALFDPDSQASLAKPTSRLSGRMRR